jgi:cyclopropane fatty-acyl-phospholipid synthase-like methyltransferase
MDDKKYWEKFYRNKPTKRHSPFADFVLPIINGNLIDIGCGDGRDLYYFIKKRIPAIGVDNAHKNTTAIVKQDIGEYLQKNESPSFVYARFFWHAIDRRLQLQILKWTKKYIFIEARTTEDKRTKKIFENHERHYVDVPRLVKDLKNNNFQIEHLTEGRGLSRYKEEDPHLVRIIAKKN